MKNNDIFPTFKKESLNKRLIKYSLTAGVALTIGSRLNADIQYTDVDPDKVITSQEFAYGKTTFSLDMNNDGSPEFKIIQSYTYSYYFYIYSYDSVMVEPVYRGLSVINATGENDYVAALNSNELISSQQNFGTKYLLGGLSYYLTSPVGEWPGNGKRFMGVKFKIGENIHYGWVRLSVPWDCRSFTVFDYAYEDVPGKDLRAGQKDYSSQDNQ